MQLGRVDKEYEKAYGKTLSAVIDSELSSIFEGNLKYFMEVLLADRSDFDAKLLTKVRPTSVKRRRSRTVVE